MYVYLKNEEIELTCSGEVPEQVLTVLLDLYGDSVVITGEDAPYRDSKWYNKVSPCMTTGEIIRSYRELANLTQARLGELIGGKSKQFISDIERGRRKITSDTAEALGKALNRPSERFIESLGHPPGKELSQDEIDQLLIRDGFL